MKRGLQEALRQYYVLTDRRAMTVRPDGDVSAMELEHMGECRLYPEGDAVSLALGSGLLEERDKQLRWRANHPMTGSDSRGADRVQGLVFYHVERSEEAMRLLRTFQASEREGV